VDIFDIEEQTATVEVNGTPYQVELVNEVYKPITSKPVATIAAPSVSQVAPATVTPPKSATPTSGNVIKSPLPGAVLDIFVKVGDSVKQGQHVLKLEAMKMENNIDADHDGIVKEVRVHKNDSVMEGDILIVFQ
jgi:biotin carboxyl carrier protein